MRCGTSRPPRSTPGAGGPELKRTTRPDAPGAVGAARAGTGITRDAIAALSIAVLATALAAAALAPVGAGADQALFVYYAERLRAGAMLYTDLWDNKQPGIFGFYALAGALPGDGWPATRLLYATWLGASAGVLAWIARVVAPGTSAWIVVPVATVGLALLRTTIDRPAQVESLVGLPLSALLLLVVTEPAGRGGRTLRWIAVGALTGCVAALKLVLAPVPAAMVGCALGWRIARGDLDVRAAIRAGLLTLVGFAVLWVPILGWVAANGAWTEFRWTLLDYPRLALAQVERQNPANILGALRWLAITVGLMTPAAVWYGWRALRATRSTAALLTLACAAWVGVGLAMFLTQRFSWWDTHMDLVTWPFGLLGALGVSTLPARPRGTVPGRVPGWAAAALVGAMALNLAVHGARFAQRLSSDPEWPGPSVERAALDVARTVAATARAPCGTVYAIGDRAGVERATGLRQAIATHGLWFGAFLPAQAERLPAELEAARPDLVYYDDDEQRDFERRFPRAAARLDAWLQAGYAPVREDPLGGRWWQRRVEAGDGATCPAPRRFSVPAAVSG